MASHLDDIDTVHARFEQAGAIVDLMSFALTAEDNHSIIGTASLENACSAIDELLKQGRAAFQRIDQARTAKREGQVMTLKGNPGIVEGADAPDSDTAVDLVCARLDMAHGVLNTMSNAFSENGGCTVPDERLRECIMGAILIVGEAPA